MEISPPEKRRSFSLEEKRTICTLAYRKPNNIKPVARQFWVQGNMIRRWRRADLDGGTLVRRRGDGSRIKRRRSGGGRKIILNSTTIIKLKKFFDDQRNADYAVSLQILVAECRRVALPMELDGVSRCALFTRIYRVLGRWDQSWRRSTHKAQNTRYAGQIIKDFIEYVHDKNRFLEVDPSLVYNVDETNVFFSQQTPFTYAQRGSRTVSVKSVNSSSRCTAMLGGSMSGKKLPPFIIFKGTNKASGHIRREVREGVDYPEGIEYGVQEKAWMDEPLMLEWIDKVWKPEVVYNNITYLILDECQTHLTTKVRAAFVECNTEIELIPAGYTSKIIKDIFLQRSNSLSMTL